MSASVPRFSRGRQEIWIDQDIDCLPGASNWGEKQTFKQISVHRVASTMQEVQAGWYRHSLWGLGQ